MFESWEEEDYCPGEPQIPLGSYKYKNVKDFPKTKGGSSLSETKKLGDVKGKKKVVSTNKNIHRADGKAIPEVFIDLTCDSPEKRYFGLEALEHELVAGSRGIPRPPPSKTY
ncbi:uncharacterized protein LOC144654473 [Oculina patagonica]